MPDRITRPLACALVVAVLWPTTGCKRFLRTPAHIPATTEAYWVRKIAEVDADAAVCPPPRREEIYGAGPKVREELGDDFWLMTLHSAINIALQNNQVIRQDTQFLSTTNPILGAIDTTASALDPQIQDTNVLFGSRGIAAAMADFTPQIAGNLIYTAEETFLNGQGLGVGDNRDSTADFDVSITKQLAFGGSLSLVNSIDFLGANNRLLGLNSAHTGSIGVNFNMPLWAASGTEFTQIAGPADFLVPRVTSVNQGILISRINSEVARLDLEINVRQLVRDVVNVYWDLTLAYGQYEAEAVAYESARELYDQQKAKLTTGQASAAEEAQAAETFLASEARQREALRSIEENEQRLRRLLALPVTDGQLIKPADDPVVVELPPYWNAVVDGALQRRPQLKRTKHNLRSLQLQLKAAKSLTKPRLDLVSGYRVNGFGDRIAGGGGTAPNRTLLGEFASTDLEGWTAGVTFSMPLNFQLERSQVDNLQLRIAKSRVQLAAQEAEISHELAVAMQNAQNWANISGVQKKRLEAAQTLVDALEAEYDRGRPALDRLVRSQTTLAQAKIDYRRSLVEFSRANSELQFRRSVLLETNGINLQFPGVNVAGNFDGLPEHAIEKRVGRAVHTAARATANTAAKVIGLPVRTAAAAVDGHAGFPRTYRLSDAELQNTSSTDEVPESSN